MSDNIKKASSIVFNYLKDRNINNLQELTSFFGNWEEIAGEASHYGNVKDIKNSTLIIETDHPAKSTLLQTQKRTILRNLNKVYPELGIKDIHILVRQKYIDKAQEYMDSVKMLEESEKKQDRDFEKILKRLNDLADNQSWHSKHKKYILYPKLETIYFIIYGVFKWKEHIILAGLKETENSDLEKKWAQ